MNTVKPMYEWKDIPWKRVEKNVFKLQKRIYRASLRGDVKTVHNLQRLLLKSWSAKCLAVRRVTQDNKGKKTAGIDGIKSLSPQQRLELVRNLSVSQKPKPVRRVWIAKPGKQEKRPLGIPIMQDRALQALVKLVLEPEWEAKFEPNSYGFRPGRSCQDAIGAIYISIKQKAKYVLDADIAKCYDRINHQRLMEKLNTYPTLRKVIKGWLKAGVMDGGELYPTEEGTPQGGVVSPLLANIALHGLELAIREAYSKINKKTNTKWKPTVVRYADDLVILHPDLEALKEAKSIAKEWLADMGLELKPSKTRITHTLNYYEGNVGFDFLGFNIRQYKVGRTHSGKRGGYRQKSQLLGFKTIIKPSKDAQKRHLQRIKEAIKRDLSATQEGLIDNLNPIIRGWANYYSAVCSKRVYGRMDNLIYFKLKNWALHRHRRKSTGWAIRKYWRLEKGTWRFATHKGHELYKHAKTPIKRHVKVKGKKSPYDGDWIYWSARMGKHPEVSKGVARLLKKQKGKCNYCGLYVKDGDRLEVDHITPRTKEGKDGYKNLQLLHRHCHDEKSAKERCL